MIIATAGNRYHFSVVIAVALTLCCSSTDGAVETTRDNVANKLDSVALWIDRFFDDPEQRDRSAGTLLRVKQRVTGSLRDQSEYKTTVSARLHLPNLSESLSVVFRGDDTLPPIGEDGKSDVQGGLVDATDAPAVAIRYQVEPYRYWSSSVLVGARIKSGSAYTGVRLRYNYPLTDFWSIQAAGRQRWYTNGLSDSDARFDLNRKVGSSGIFRQQLVMQWRDANIAVNDLRTTVTTSYGWRGRNKDAYRIDWQTRMEPRSNLVDSSLQFRYRRKLGYEWLFLEVVPRLSFQDVHHWHVNPGFQVSLEIVFNRAHDYSHTD